MSSNNLLLVLITGASGYIGSHVLQQTLQAGHQVRATARPSKVAALRERYEGKVDVVGVEDLATGDYSEALKGVGAVIHVAAPMPGKADPAGMIDGAAEGALNILRQAAAAGVKRFVVTSSIVTAIDFSAPAHTSLYGNKTYTDKDWNPATREQALAGEHDSMWVYCAAKTVAERGVWAFADAHPEVDVTTINPTFVYGPFAPGTKIGKGDIPALSTAALFYQAVLPQGGSASNTVDRTPQSIAAPLTIDVRDVARAHALALRAPPTAQVGRKRLLVAGPSFAWFDAVVHLRKVMPELSSRLPKVAEGAEGKPPVSVAGVDVSRAKEVLGLEEYVDWKKTVEDTTKALLEVEESWETHYHV